MGYGYAMALLDDLLNPITGAVQDLVAALLGHSWRVMNTNMQGSQTLKSSCTCTWQASPTHMDGRSCRREWESHVKIKLGVVPASVPNEP